VATKAADGTYAAATSLATTIPFAPRAPKAYESARSLVGTHHEHEDHRLGLFGRPAVSVTSWETVRWSRPRPRDRLDDSGHCGARQSFGHTVSRSFCPGTAHLAAIHFALIDVATVDPHRIFSTSVSRQRGVEQSGSSSRAHNRSPVQILPPHEDRWPSKAWAIVLFGTHFSRRSPKMWSQRLRTCCANCEVSVVLSHFGLGSCVSLLGPAFGCPVTVASVVLSHSPPPP